MDGLECPGRTGCSGRTDARITGRLRSERCGTGDRRDRRAGVGDRIAALSETAETPLRIGIDAREAQALTFAVVGVFVLVDGLQDAAAAASVFWSKPDAAPAVSYMWERQGEGIIEALVQIAAGAVLILGRDPFVQGWMRLRTGRAHDLDDSNAH